jgi:hypothetical protein
LHQQGNSARGNFSRRVARISYREFRDVIQAVRLFGGGEYAAPDEIADLFFT